MGPELSAYSDALDRRVDTLLFGRPVWQMMVGFWPNAEAISQDPHVTAFALFWRATPKIVFSHGYPGDEWTTRVVRGDLQAEVTALKAQPGADLLLTGGVIAVRRTRLRMSRPTRRGKRQGHEVKDLSRLSTRARSRVSAV